MLPWTFVAAAVARPGAFGAALLILRSDLVAGLVRLAGVWSQLVAPILLGAVLVSFVAPRLARRPLDGAAAFDAASLALAPLVLVVGLGVLLEELGMPRAWLPAASPRRLDLAGVVAMTLRYGWSVAVLGLVLLEARRLTPTADETPATP